MASACRRAFLCARISACAATSSSGRMGGAFFTPRIKHNPASPEDEEMATAGVALEGLLDLERQAVHPSTHIRVAGCRPHPGARRKRDHRRRCRTFNTAASAARTVPGSTDCQVPPTPARRSLPSGRPRPDPGDDKIVSMHARGMTVCEIQGYLAELYSIDVSPDLINAVTDAILDPVVRRPAAHHLGQNLDPLQVPLAHRHPAQFRPPNPIAPGETPIFLLCGQVTF